MRVIFFFFFLLLLLLLLALSFVVMPATRRGRSRPSRGNSPHPSGRRQVRFQSPTVDPAIESIHDESTDGHDAQNDPANTVASQNTSDSAVEARESLLTMVREEFQALRQMIGAPPPPAPGHQPSHQHQSYTPGGTTENGWSPSAGMSQW